MSEKVQVSKITIEGETISPAQIAVSWKDAWSILVFNCNCFLGYDKTWIKVEWADGNTESFRFDVNGKWLGYYGSLQSALEEDVKSSLKGAKKYPKIYTANDIAILNLLLEKYI